MPWQAFKVGDEYCVYKLDADGDKTGDSLSCHATKSEADDQVAALYVNAGDEEERAAMGLFRQFWKGLREILNPNQERAISMPRLYGMVDSLLYDMEGWPWLMDVYVDDGSLYALITGEGKLYRYALIIQDEQVALGERVQVMEAHPAVVGERGRTIVRQQPDGRWRWFSVSATAVLNRVGEIDSRALFDSFVAHAEKTDEYPIRMFYHQGTAFRTGQADYLARDGYCYVTSGLFDDTPLARAEVAARQAAPDYWGESIGYPPTEAPEFVEIANGIKIPVYTAGINREISTLPEHEAANLFTVTNQEVYRMSMMGNAWEAFVKLWRDAGEEDPEEAARRWLEENAGERNRAIETEGFIARDGGESPEDNEPSGDDDPPAGDESDSEPEPDEIVLDDEAVEAIAGRMAESGTFAELAEAVDAMRGELSQTINDVRSLRQRLDEVDRGVDERLVRLERDDDDKRREWQADMPAQSRTRITYRPRERHAADEDDPQPAGGTLGGWEREKQEKGIGY